MLTVQLIPLSASTTCVYNAAVNRLTVNRNANQEWILTVQPVLSASTTSAHPNLALVRRLKANLYANLEWILIVQLVSSATLPKANV